MKHARYIKQSPSDGLEGETLRWGCVRAQIDIYLLRVRCVMRWVSKQRAENRGGVVAVETWPSFLGGDSLESARRL